MAVRPELIKDQAGQSLVFESLEGRPTSTPEVGTKTKHGVELSAAADTNVTIDNVSTTISASASIGDESVTVADETGISVGSTYLITNSLGQSERVRVVGVNSSTKEILLDEPIEYDYANSDTFVGTRFYYALQTADIDTLRDTNVATATYATDSGNYTVTQVFDVVLHPLVNPLSVAGIKRRWPDLMRQEFEEQQGEDYRRQRGLAWEQIKRELRHLGKRPALVVSPEDLEDWAYWELALLLQESGTKIMRNLDQAEALDRIESRIDESKETAIATLSWHDTDQDESSSADETDNRVLDLVR